MSGDEVITMVVSGILGVVGWKEWLKGLMFLDRLSRRAVTQLIAWAAPLLAGLAMYYVLLHWSSDDVQENPVYIFFYMMVWLGWTGLWNWLLPDVGLSFRDDALERGNTAAGLAVGGGLLGVTFAFAGGNIGDGPGWWVVVFCASLGTTLMLVFWILGNRLTRVCEAITIDRDLAAGWRAGGFFIGAGLILGRAVAGNWISLPQALSDFLGKGWPALILWGLAVVLDMAGRPTPARPKPNALLFGVLPAGLFIAGGICDVILQGPWQ